MHLTGGLMLMNAHFLSQAVRKIKHPKRAGLPRHHPHWMTTVSHRSVYSLKTPQIGMDGEMPKPISKCKSNNQKEFNYEF